MKYVYLVLYFLYLLVMIIYGETMEFAVPVPVLVSALMLIVVFFIEKELPFDIYCKFYSVFVVCYIVSELVTGYSRWIPRFTAYYAECYCAYAATLLLVKRFHGSSYLAVVLITIGMVDAVVTIGQAYNNPLAERIMLALIIQKSHDLEMMQDSGIDMMGNYIPGIFSTVKNGFFLLMTTILTLHFQKHPFKLVRWIGFYLSLIALYATFLTQERSAFLLAAFFVILMAYKLFLGINTMMKPLLRILFVVVTGWTVSEVYLTIMEGENRFSSSVFRDDSRLTIYSKVFDFILQNPIVGGHGLYFNTMQKAPHNLFLNAYVYGGFCGFVAIVALCYKQWKMILRQAWLRVSPQNLSCLTFGFAFLAYNLHGMTHNSSLVTGDIILWVLWAGFFVQYNQKDK